MLVQYLPDYKGVFGGFTECYLVVNGCRYPFLACLYTLTPMFPSDQIRGFAKYGVNLQPDFVNVLVQSQMPFLAKKRNEIYQ
jgi:hypothetical protein